MFINEEEIKYDNFQSMCRTCLQNINLNSIKNNFIIEVLHNITDINYRIDEELPQNICDICIKKIHEIQAFAFQCIEIDLTLRKCLSARNENLKKEQDISEQIIKQEFPKDEIQDVSVLETNKTQIEFYEIADLKFDENVIDVEENSTSCGNFEKWFQKSNDINYSYMTFTKDDNSDAESDNSTNLNIIVENDDVTTRTCELCNISFSEFNLQKHIDEYHAKRICTFCGIEFTNRDLFLKHHKKHTKKKLEVTTRDEFKCDICQKMYRTKAGLKHHKELFAGRHHYCCEICSQVYSKLSGLQMHKKKHRFSQYLMCEICNKVFHKSRSLREHVKKVHFRKKKQLIEK